MSYPFLGLQPLREGQGCTPADPNTGGPSSSCEIKNRKRSHFSELSILGLLRTYKKLQGFSYVRSKPN